MGGTHGLGTLAVSELRPHAAGLPPHVLLLMLLTLGPSPLPSPRGLLWRRAAGNSAELWHRERPVEGATSGRQTDTELESPRH